jgi:hypothetical protein
MIVDCPKVMGLGPIGIGQKMDNTDGLTLSIDKKCQSAAFWPRDCF